MNINDFDISAFRKDDIKDSDFILVKAPISKYPKDKITDVFRKIQDQLELKNMIVFVPSEIDIEVVGKDQIKDMISKLESLL